MLSQDNISPTPLDTVCELLTISSDSSIRSTFHYPLSRVGRHEDKEEVEPEWRLIQRSTGKASTWPILLSRGSSVSLLGVTFAMRAFDTLSTVRMTTLHCEMVCCFKILSLNSFLFFLVSYWKCLHGRLWMAKC